MEAVRTVRNGFVSTIILSRPQARNAVDSKTASALCIKIFILFLYFSVNAFQEFEKDDNARVAILWGDNNTFCSGAGNFFKLNSKKYSKNSIRS